MHYGLAAAKREQRGRVLAGAFAKHPERFPNGCPVPRALPTAVWINPPKSSIIVGEIENTMTPESDPITIGAVRSSWEADLGQEQPESPNLILEEPCMSVAQ